MKNILFIYNKSFLEAHSRHIHSHWAIDCRNDYNIDFWGKGFVTDKDLTIKLLKKRIDEFKPDYIYMTGRKKYHFKKTKKVFECWLPDLTGIKNVPKIFVEVDSYRYMVSDEWYKQFNQLYCRNNKWNDWNGVPVLKWSVSEIAFSNKTHIERKGIYFVGTIDNRPYWYRRKMRDSLSNRINFCTVYPDEYWDILHSSSALVCPTEGRIYKDVEPYVPAKLFEYCASGAAVLTNCDIFAESGIVGLDEVVIKYTSLEDLKDKLDMDFSKYYNKASEVMKNHTHKVRYKELFG